MTSISTLSNSRVNTAQSASSAAKPTLGKFEINSKQYGPVVATAISVADTVGDAASAVYHFSEESLQELAKLPGEAYDTAKDVVDAVEDGVESVAHDVASAASKGLKQVESAYDAVEHMATTVGKSLSSGLTAANKATDAVTDAVSSVAKEVGSGAVTVAGYTALGLGAAASKLGGLV